MGHDVPAPTDGPIARAIHRAHGVLPDQGPIGVFIHHNTLHAFQHLPFHEGVQAGAALTGARPYLSLEQFREAFRAGRIEAEDVVAAIHEHLGERAHAIGALGLPLSICWELLMREVIETDDETGLRFGIAEGTAPVTPDRPRWEASLARVTRGPLPAAKVATPPLRHRDLLLVLGGGDVDAIVHPELVRLSAGFLDQGQARDVLPGREAGFLASVSSLYAAGGRAPRGCEGVVADLSEIARDGRAAEAVVADLLRELGVPAESQEAYLLATALALPGWAGMFSRLERHPEERVDAVAPRLIEFLAVRLLFERRAIQAAAALLSVPQHWAVLRTLLPSASPAGPVAGALVLWAFARRAGLAPSAVSALSGVELQQCWAVWESATPVLRRQLWQEAYERRYRRQILDALAAHRGASASSSGASISSPSRRLAQVVFCIDEREESIRRAIEEQGAEYETFGAAGFFGVAIDFQGLYDSSPAAHCPVVVIPGHEVHEGPVPSEEGWHETRSRWRSRWMAIERLIGRQSRTLTGGAGLSFVLGPLAGVAAAGRVVAPRGTLAMRDRLLARFLPRPTTQLSALRDEFQRRASESGKPIGFSLTESTDRVAGVLQNLGLVQDFAPFVIILGHGSTSLNNPHESAHDCGACGGRRGGANARLFAELANRPDVRAELRGRGIAVPDDTIFIGGLHDTADDRIQLFDLGAIPATHDARFEQVCVMLEQARRESARERARRFDDAPLGLTPAEALAHVEARASHLAQPRPEYGHCTNAICVVGRRALTRGLHLDRRPFLVSYDPTNDDESRILERILAAVGPVGAGISLEYYFSAVDNGRYGCGTKLPHNVTGLLGVMNGHQGDLQTGLPLQMVELHEPMRLLLIVEATPDALLAVAGRQAEVAELVTKEWVQLISLDPTTGEMHRFTRGGFERYLPASVELPTVERSIDWHGRSRVFLPPARVMAGAGGHE